MPENRFEAAARAKKVNALVDFIWNMLSPANRIDSESIMLLRRFNDESWSMLADAAGVNPPSDTSRAQVIQIITQRVKDARWGFDHGKAIA